MVRAVKRHGTPACSAAPGEDGVQKRFGPLCCRRNLLQGQTIGTAKVFGGSSGRVALRADGEVKVMLPKSGADKLVARIVYTGPVPAPVAEGTPIGNLKVWRNDNLILTMPLKVGENVGKGNMPQRAFDAVTEMIIALFRAGAERL